MIIFILYLSVVEYTTNSIVMDLHDYLQVRYLRKRPTSHEHNITVIQYAQVSVRDTLLTGPAPLETEAILYNLRIVILSFIMIYRYRINGSFKFRKTNNSSPTGQQLNMTNNTSNLSRPFKIKTITRSYLTTKLQ